MIRQGGRHEIWARRKARAAMPRKRELKKGTVRSICADLGVPVPEGER